MLYNGETFLPLLCPLKVNICIYDNIIALIFKGSILVWNHISNQQCSSETFVFQMTQVIYR